MESYELGKTAAGEPFILCLVCKAKSFNPIDIERHYCGYCHEFHSILVNRRIWITQWLCPKRHCSIAMMWNPLERTACAVEEKGEALYKSGAIKRICALCASETITPEHRPTRWTTMAEAERGGRVLEADNLATRAAIEEIAAKGRN